MHGSAPARPAGRDGDGARRGHACGLPRRDQAGDAAAAKDLETSLDRIARRTLALKLKLHLAQKRQEMDRAEEKTQRRRQVARAVSCSIGDDSVGAEKGEALLASRKTPPGWIALFTEKRFDRPPWELKLRGR